MILTKYINFIIEKIKTPLFMFIIANALYSFSTWLISLLSPYVLEKETYEHFIYSFQTMLYVASISTLGLVPTLLRYYKYGNEKYQTYFLYCITAIVLFLLLIGGIPENPLSIFLNIDDYILPNHWMFYLSSVSVLLFVFNRAILTAQEKYTLLIKTIFIIFFVRIISLLIVKIFGITSDTIVLFLICVLPLSWEFVFYLRKLINIKIVFDTKEFRDFIVFSLLTSAIGIIYVTTSRLYLLELKSQNSTIVPIISYIYGMLGVITIFNTSFTSFFIGKLDGRNIIQVASYLNRIKKYSIPFLLFSIGLSALLYLFVFCVYPYDHATAAIFAAIAAMSSSLTAFVGLISLMTKTFNLLKIQLIINIVSFLVTLVFVKHIPNIESYLMYCFLSVIHLSFEMIVAYIVIRKFNYLKVQANNK